MAYVRDIYMPYEEEEDEYDDEEDYDDDEY